MTSHVSDASKRRARPTEKQAERSPTSPASFRPGGLEGRPWIKSCKGMPPAASPAAQAGIGLEGSGDHGVHRLARSGGPDPRGEVEPTGPMAVTVTVEGESDLLDAFELACSLGPAGCIVRDVERRPPGQVGLRAGREE